MKLKDFKIVNDYIFDFIFINDFQKKVNIKTLIDSKLSLEELETAKIDKDWGCLEFKNGLFDIEPKTLYNFVLNSKEN